MLHFLLATLFLAGGAVGVAHAAPAPEIAWSTVLNVPVYMQPQAQDGSFYLTSTQMTGPNLFAFARKSKRNCYGAMQPRV